MGSEVKIMPIRSFLDLDVYKKSYQAALLVNKDIIPKLPTTEKYDLIDQLRRASKAIPAIIAEGYARKHHKKDWQKYIDQGIGEANEMIVHLSLVKDLYARCVNVKLCEELIKTYDIIGKQLFNLGKNWNSVFPTSHFSPPNSSPTSSNPTSHLLLFLAPLAQIKVTGYDPIEPPPGIPKGGAETLGNILSVAFGVLSVGGILLALFFIVWGGLSWIMSRGDKQKLDSARKTIIWALAGLVIITLSFVMIRFASDLLGLDFG